MWIGFWICFEFRQKSIKLQFCFISFNSSSLYWCCLFGLPPCLCMAKFSTMLKIPSTLCLYPIWLHIWVWHNISVCQRRFSTGGGILGAYKFVFLCFHSNRYYTVCFMWVLKFHFKVFESLQSIATLLLVLSSDEQKRDLSSLFSKERRLHQYYAFPKEYNIKFQVAKSLENPFSFVVVLKTSNI